MTERPEQPAPVDDQKALDAVASTARLTAALRARESSRDDALFDDPFAARLAGDDQEGLLQSFGDNPTIATRTRYFDDELAGVVGSGVNQVAILAAGMDTRAFRLPFLAPTTVFELDRAEMLSLKDRLLARGDPAPVPRCDRRPVGVDLTREWPRGLVDAGFDRTEPTCWLVEGLAQYLTEPQVLGLLDGLTALSAAGSELLMDFVGQSLLDMPAMQPMLERMAELGAPWRYGTDRPEDVLTARGWQPNVVLSSTIGTRFGRWPYPDAPRDTPGVGQGFFVRAHC